MPLNFGVICYASIVTGLDPVDHWMAGEDRTRIQMDVGLGHSFRYRRLRFVEEKVLRLNLTLSPWRSGHKGKDRR